MLCFTQCSSTQKLQKEVLTSFGEVYFQKWNSDVFGGGSGIRIYIPEEDASIALDSVYFRGMVSKLKQDPKNKTLYVGLLKTRINLHKDIIMSNDPNEERENELPLTPVNFPFKLNDDQCVVSYKQGSKTVYYKISNLKEVHQSDYPSTSKEWHKNDLLCKIGFFGW